MSKKSGPFSWGGPSILQMRSWKHNLFLQLIISLVFTTGKTTKWAWFARTFETERKASWRRIVVDYKTFSWNPDNRAFATGDTWRKKNVRPKEEGAMIDSLCFKIPLYSRLRNKKVLPKSQLIYTRSIHAHFPTYTLPFYSAPPLSLTCIGLPPSL